MTQPDLPEIPTRHHVPQTVPSADVLADFIADGFGITAEKAKDWIISAYFDLELPF